MNATTTRPRTAREPITLRSNFGSYREVIDVFAFDAIRGTALVKFAGDPPGYECVGLSELEALDASRRYVSVEQAVRHMADEISE